MSSTRYARQIAVPGIGPRGQEAITRAEICVAGDDLAAEVCALYLAGAGVGALSVSPRLVEPCRALNSEIRVTARAEAPSGFFVDVGGPRARFSPDASGDPVTDGAIAARWALACILSEGSGASR